MTTYNVRKDGSGTHTTIQSAIYQAINGDTINIGAGTFYENVELSSKSLTLQGAGKDITIIEGKLANDTLACSWFAGESTITTSDSTSALIVGKSVTGTNITSNSKVATIISNTQFSVSLPTATTGNYTKTVAAYQTVAFSVAPTSGTFKLRYNGTDTASINWNASAATIQTALRAISGLSTVVVTGTISSKLLTITFDGVATPVTALSVGANALAPSTVITPTLIEALVLGSSTVILPNTTSVAVGHKVEGTGVNAIITAWNSTTKTATLSSPITQTGSGVVLSFKLARTGTLTQVASPSSSSGPGSIMVMGITDGVVIKDLTALGFDGTVGQEAAALFFTAGTSPGHQNFLIDNCRFTAVGDSAVMCGSNPYMNHGTFQNCIIDGKTFTGSEPADVPSFSTYVASGIVKSIGASTSVITFSDMRGIINGRTFTCASAFAGSATISAVSGSDVTFNKIATFNVGDTLDCTFTLTAYAVPNCARNLFYIGQNITPCNTQNITFKNNVVNGQSGAVISATGSVQMFNTAVTIESVGGLVENNLIDGNFGAGLNPLGSNYAIRCRQAEIIVQNNTNMETGGRINSEFYVALGTSINNINITKAFVEPLQASSGQAVAVGIDSVQLKAISKVSSDAVFSNEANWHLVSCIYKHENSSRRLFTSFNDLGVTRNMKLKSGMVSGDKFQLHKIIISTSNRTLLVLKRDEISNAETYDFTLL
jgi:hypothetical protein